MNCKIMVLSGKMKQNEIYNTITIYVNYKYMDTQQHTLPWTNTNIKMHFGHIRIVASEDVGKEAGLKV